MFLSLRALSRSNALSSDVLFAVSKNSPVNYAMCNIPA